MAVASDQQSTPKEPPPLSTPLPTMAADVTPLTEAAPPPDNAIANTPELVDQEVTTLDESEEPGPCERCSKPIENGTIIIFNDKFWHTTCFHCISCDILLDLSMSVYIHSTGKPICGNCLKNCNFCNKPIIDTAMMYGTKLYHIECFRCRECHALINDTVYADTSRGVFCVKCHNELMAKSRQRHDERRRREKERRERRARHEGEKLSPNTGVDRDKSLPAPPPEPSPNLNTPSSLGSPASPLSEAVFQNHLLAAGRMNGAAEAELRAMKRQSRNMAAMKETELKLNGISTESSLPVEQTSSTTEHPKEQEPSPIDPADDVEAAFIPVVLDKSSLPNSPDPTQLENYFESPVLGYHATQPPPINNPQIQKVLWSEPPKSASPSPPREETVPPVNLERRSSISTMAKEATEAITRKISLRSRRKNSRTPSNTSQDWKLEDIPRRKNSLVNNITTVPLPETAPAAPRSAIPDFPTPPTNESRSATLPGSGTKSDSGPSSPAQFMMRNESVSEVSTALTPTSLTFEGKNATSSPPIPTRNPHHHSPKPSFTNPRESRQVPNPEGTKASSRYSASYIQMDDSRPSTAASEKPPQPQPPPPQQQPMPTTPFKLLDISPQLPSIPSPGLLGFEDEMSQLWQEHRRNASHERKTSVSSLGSLVGHKRGQSSSSQTGSAAANMLSKVTSTIRHARTTSNDRKAGTHSRQSSKGQSVSHSRNASQPSIFAATIFAEAEEEKEILREQLRKSTHQIVELEIKLQEDEEVKAGLTEKRVSSAKNALAGVESEREIAMKELKILLKHKQALQESSSFGARESCDAIIRDFEKSLETLKDEMRQEIKQYTVERAQLIEETVRLRSLRDNYLEEAQQLNKKNDELADLNNDIQRNMDRSPNHVKVPSEGRPGGFSLFKTHKKDSPTAASISSVQSVGLAHPMFMDSKQSLESTAPVLESPMSRVSDSTIVPEDSTLTQAVVMHVSDQDSLGLPAPPKKINYWKKNAGVLRKAAVKGFKSAWNGETNILISSPQAQISTPQLVSSSSQGNGLNILLPYSTPSPAATPDYYQPEAYKSHSFHPKAFKRWQKCGYCGERLSGTEVRCVDCDYQCHTKCLMSVVQPCSKGRKPLRDTDSASIASETASLFGNDLARQAEIEGRPVPYIITRCIEEVEAHGIEYEGIYRKSGGASSLRAIVDAFEAGGEVNFDHLVGSGDICAVTSALKQYLRNLPDPLIPYGVYDRFLQAASVNDTSLKTVKFKNALLALPKVNHDCLRLLMLHLSRVVEKSDINLMHASNLAVVFSPTVMRDMTGARQIADMQSTNMCVKYLIENANSLFASPRAERSNDSISSVSRYTDRRI